MNQQTQFQFLCQSLKHSLKPRRLKSLLPRKLNRRQKLSSFHPNNNSNINNFINNLRCLLMCCNNNPQPHMEGFLACRINNSAHPRRLQQANSNNHRRMGLLDTVHLAQQHLLVVKIEVKVHNCWLNKAKCRARSRKPRQRKLRPKLKLRLRLRLNRRNKRSVGIMDIIKPCHSKGNRMERLDSLKARHNHWDGQDLLRAINPKGSEWKVLLCRMRSNHRNSKFNMHSNKLMRCMLVGRMDFQRQDLGITRSNTHSQALGNLGNRLGMLRSLILHMVRFFNVFGEFCHDEQQWSHANLESFNSKANQSKLGDEKGPPNGKIPLDQWT
jgi:hypothetical protein